MKQTFIFFYSIKFEPNKLKTAIPAHIAYWEKLASEAFTEGPFRDRSGGLIISPAEDQRAAEDICNNDPYVKEGLVVEYQVKEWLISHQR